MVRTVFLREQRRHEEADLLETVRQLAALYGWRFYHVRDSRGSPAGFPDVLLCRPPRLIFAELKSASGRVTGAQQAWLDLLAACPGVEPHIWRPADVDAIGRVLSRGER